MHAATRPADAHLRDAERAENFPVALWLLPARLRHRLRVVYAVVRTIDDLGDEGPPGPARMAALEAFAADLALVLAGDGREPSTPVLRALMPLARGGVLPREPFELLLMANRIDQKVQRYRTWQELLAYCALSAQPIGRLVLACADVHTPPGSPLHRRAADVCTALQLLEHRQDVVEDRVRGRTYLPADDLAAFGVADAKLDAATASPALRGLIAHETERPEALLDAGEGLVRELDGAVRLAVAGYVAGGRAAADALRRARFDVLATSPCARRRDLARHALALLRAARR